jgi:hypothetical protein
VLFVWYAFVIFVPLETSQPLIELLLHLIHLISLGIIWEWGTIGCNKLRVDLWSGVGWLVGEGRGDRDVGVAGFGLGVFGKEGKRGQGLTFGLTRVNIKRGGEWAGISLVDLGLGNGCGLDQGWGGFG